MCELLRFLLTTAALAFALGGHDSPHTEIETEYRHFARAEVTGNGS